MEQYLLVIKSAKLKKNLTQLRVSSHKLYIETGRQSQPYKDPLDRVCFYCDNHAIEDEKHFVIKCPLYNTLRSNLFDELITIFPIFGSYDHNEKFIWLFSNLDPRVINLFARYISDCFKKRSVSEKL